MKSITVTFDGDGNSAIETTGFVGTACLKETVALEQALGKKTKDANKREMTATSTSEVQRAKQ
jgi:hypothetical protein